MTYSLPFRDGIRVLELGGGDRPIYRPNVDVRPGPKVDFVADFSVGLPIASDEWDGVYSSYNVEHVSWRRVRAHLREVRRILRPGGTAVFVTANLLEQARMLVQIGDAGAWEDRWTGMIFGDLDYVENSHKCGFSPEFLCRLLREAGFSRVLVVPHGELGTDMIAEAVK